MAALTICSDFGVQKNKVWHCFHCFPVYFPWTDVGALQYVRQILTSMKGEINNNTIIVGNLNTPLTPMDRPTKQKINKETQTLNDTIDQLD